MADFLKDNSVVTIFLDDDNPGDGNAIAKAQEPASLDDAVVLAGVADEPVAGETSPESEADSASEAVPDPVPVIEAEAEIHEMSEAPFASEVEVLNETASIGVDEVDVDALEAEAPVPDPVASKAEIFDAATEFESAHEEEDDTIAVIGQNRVTVVNPRRAPHVNPVNPSADLDKYVMYQNSVRSSNTLGFGLVLLMLAVALIVVLWVGFGFIADQAKEQGAQTLRDSIMDSAMQCFAIEGYYPPSLEYLQENYGLSVNEGDYLVIYEAFASNVPPTVDVRLR